MGGQYGESDGRAGWGVGWEKGGAPHYARYEVKIRRSENKEEIEPLTE